MRSPLLVCAPLRRFRTAALLLTFWLSCTLLLCWGAEKERANVVHRGLPPIHELESIVPNLHHLYTGHIPLLAQSNQRSDSELCMFGAQVAEAVNKGGSWQDVCWQDADGDTYTNGLEMGDPCCEWKPGDLPYRTWELTHPSRDVETTNRTIASPPNCSMSKAERQPWYDKAFADFYWQTNDVVHGEASLKFLSWWWKNDDQIFLKVPLFSMAAYVLYDWGSRRGLLRDLIGVGPLAQRGEEPDLSRRGRAIVYIVAYFYSDLISGLTHIAFDFLPFYYPVFGGVARSFQYHHVHPRQAVEPPYWVMMSHLLLPVGLLFLGLGLAKPRRSFRMFWTLLAFGSIGTYSTHRWMHHHPEELPFWFTLLQGVGFLASHARHHTHHVDPTISFSQLTGHSDWLIDTFSHYIVSPYRFEFWTSMLLLAYVAPAILGSTAISAQRDLIVVGDASSGAMLKIV